MNKSNGSNKTNENEQESQQREKIRSMFNSIAPTYDLLNHLLSFGIDHSWRKKTIREIGIDEKSQILDLATGTGDLSALALKKNPRLVVGADPAFSMLYQTKKKLRNASFHAVESFGEFLPFAEKTFSHAMISYGIRNVSNRDMVFKEIYRVLNNEGKFAILEFSQSQNKFFAAIYSFYFHKLLPFVGGIISGNKEAYRYLPQSVTTFPSAENLSKELLAVGFHKKLVQPLFFGITTLFVFEKKEKA